LTETIFVGFRDYSLSLEFHNKSNQNHLSEKMICGVFGICATEIESCGLREIKRKTKTKFRELMCRYHPDTRKPWHKNGKRTWVKLSNGRSIHISYWIKRYREVMGLKYLPTTLFNFEKTLEIQKGFKSTKDVDFGLNGPT